jgi:hypothetical protein
MNNNKIINLTTPVASSDAATKGYVDSSGGDDVSSIVAITESPDSPYSLNWDAIQVCQFGACCPPWRDCDGDTKTYSASTDCDEGCATCYVGSTSYTSSPDGKDQDCDGVINESYVTDWADFTCSGYKYLVKSGTCSPSWGLYPTDDGYCQTVCAAQGKTAGGRAYCVSGNCYPGSPSAGCGGYTFWDGACASGGSTYTLWCQCKETRYQ